MIKIWGIKNCQSVKKALDFLEQNKLAYDFIDYKKNPPSQEELRRWIKKVGMQSVLNTKGRTYKELGLKDMLLDENEEIDFMHRYPTLIKRPILEINEECYFGFNEEIYAKIL